MGILQETASHRSAQKPIEILLADVSDLESLTMLADDYRTLLGQASTRPSVNQFLFERLINHEALIYWARHVETQAALGFVMLYPSFNLVSLKPLWAIDALFVTSNARRQGIGSTLVSAAQKLVQERGDEGLLMQEPTHIPETTAFLESIGFTAQTEQSAWQWLSENT